MHRQGIDPRIPNVVSGKDGAAAQVRTTMAALGIQDPKEVQHGDSPVLIEIQPGKEAGLPLNKTPAANQQGKVRRINLAIAVHIGRTGKPSAQHRQQKQPAKHSSTPQFAALDRQGYPLASMQKNAETACAQAHLLPLREQGEPAREQGMKGQTGLAAPPRES